MNNQQDTDTDYCQKCGKPKLYPNKPCPNCKHNEISLKKEPVFLKIILNIKKIFLGSKDKKCNKINKETSLVKNIFGNVKIVLLKIKNKLFRKKTIVFVVIIFYCISLENKIYNLNKKIADLEYAQTVIIDNIDSAQSLAEEAKNSSEEAQSNAEEARNNSEDAQNLATDAQDSSENAQNQADEARNNAEEAQNLAEEAQSKADELEQTKVDQ